MYYVVTFLLLALASQQSFAQDEGPPPHLEAGGVNIHEVTATNLAEYTENRWTLIEFYSPICGHCRKFAPEFALVSEYLSGVLTIARVNLDEERPIAEKFGVTSVPKLLLFAPGKQPTPYWEGKRLTATKIVDWLLETEQLPSVLSLESKEAAHAFMYPPKPVYPPRYMLVRSPGEPPEEGDENAKDAELEFESEVTLDFSEVALVKPHFAALWIVKDTDAWDYSVPALVAIPALGQGELQVHVTKQKEEKNLDGESQQQEQERDQEGSFLTTSKLTQQHKRLPPNMTVLQSGRGRTPGSTITDELTTVIWGDDDEGKID